MYSPKRLKTLKQKAAEAGLKPQLNNSEVNVESQGNFAPIELAPRNNIKVLIGKYSTFDEAKNAQINIKKCQKIAPFIRKSRQRLLSSNRFLQQYGCCKKVFAGGYSKDRYDVWIYQQ